VRSVFISLAAIADLTPIIRNELDRAGIDVVRHEKPMHNNRFAHISGTLPLNGKPAYAFERTLWKYEVQGLVPPQVAKDLEASLVGREDIKHIGEIWVIDTEVGLHFLVAVLRKHGLIDPTPITN
jgi:hypothetical protein